MKIFKLWSVITWSIVINLVVSSPNSTHIKDSVESVSRSKRHIPIWFPYNTCIALAVVLAIPLNLKGRNVYMSYNFETNFYLPYFDVKQGLVPLPFAQIDAPAVNQGTKIFYAQGGDVRNIDGSESLSESNQIGTESISSNSTVTENSVDSETIIDDSSVKPNATKSSTKKNKNQKQTKKKPKNKRVNREILQTLLSRKKMYKILEHKLELAGFNGEECLLKAICETAEQPLEEHNGVLGDIFHIIFTPTSSRDEKLPQRYYDAVYDGEMGRCRYYNTLCPHGIFDFITKTIME